MTTEMISGTEFRTRLHMTEGQFDSLLSEGMPCWEIPSEFDGEDSAILIDARIAYIWIQEMGEGFRRGYWDKLEELMLAKAPSPNVDPPSIPVDQDTVVPLNEI